MAAAVTVQDVLAGFNTQACELDIQGFIDVVNGADACLDANNIAPNVQKLLKVLAVRHLVFQSSDGGEVLEERASTGAARRFAEKKGDDTRYMLTLRQLDKTGCVISQISSSRGMFLGSVGRRNV